MQIIRPSSSKTAVVYQRNFDYVGEIGWGFSFPCDQHGTVEPLNPDAAHNYAACLTGEAGGRKVVDRGVLRLEHHYRECAVGLCEYCGAEVYLSCFTNPCDCGADYNMSGQALAPREQWGEETGESVYDILAADSDDLD